MFGRAALRSVKNGEGVVWADALQYEALCVVRLVRHAEELGVVSGSCGANILFSSLSENKTTNVRFIETCGMIKVYR